MTKKPTFLPIVDNVSLQERVYNALRAAILDMDIYSDDTDLRLDERSIAEQLGTSRTPLREALVRLEQEGFVEVQPRKGVIVLRKSMDEILEMIVTWAALESMDARLATQTASSSDLKELRNFAMKHSLHATRAEIAEYSDANVSFHQRILDLSGCSLLGEMAESLFQHMHAVRNRTMGEAERVKNSIVDHMEIIEALECRDADLAERLVREHTMKLHRHVRETWLEMGPPKTNEGAVA